MSAIRAAVLKNDKGVLLPNTAQESVSECEHWCSTHLSSFVAVIERGGQVVPVEIREVESNPVLPSPTTDLLDAATRVGRYLEERSRARQLDPEEISSMNSGSDREANLFTADLKLLTEYVKQLSDAK